MNYYSYSYTNISKLLLNRYPTTPQQESSIDEVCHRRRWVLVIKCWTLENCVLWFGFAFFPHTHIIARLIWLLTDNHRSLTLTLLLHSAADEEKPVGKRMRKKDKFIIFGLKKLTPLFCLSSSSSQLIIFPSIFDCICLYHIFTEYQSTKYIHPESRVLSSKSKPTEKA